MVGLRFSLVRRSNSSHLGRLPSYHVLPSQLQSRPLRNHANLRNLSSPNKANRPSNLGNQRPTERERGKRAMPRSARLTLRRQNLLRLRS
jgi:hypothetical protein